jgi:hypothetical protein
MILCYTPHPSFILKVLLGAGFEKNCLQNTLNAGLRHGLAVAAFTVSASSMMK